MGFKFKENKHRSRKIKKCKGRISIVIMLHFCRIGIQRFSQDFILFSM